MRLIFSKEFRKAYKKLAIPLQKQINKQLSFLERGEFRHPSLKSKKMKGENTFEARVSKGYRMRYQVKDDSIRFLTVGQHDTGLGKK